MGELESVRRNLEERVAQRTKELSDATARFETALRGVRAFVFEQDKDLRYTWAYNPDTQSSGSQIEGQTDEDMLPPTERDFIIALKRKVIETGKPASHEVNYLLPDRSSLVSLHIDPRIAPDGTVDGIVCAALDISRTRTLESEQRRLTEELGTAVQRYETALRGSNVTVFTQDENLRYTSISNDFLGRPADDIVGSDEERVIPAESLQKVVGIKREALDTGESSSGEVEVASDDHTRWFDLHVEPLRDLQGVMVGLTGAVVDITDRKENEAHLRLLLRELTHRSKNLLAVIQAMARQTARHVGSTEAFLDQFSARLQALATSHDLLVQESWHGASLHELVRMQLSHHLDRFESQLTFDGPPVLLKPEAAQGLGLGLHELATNAVKYGALSVPQGRIDIRWRRMPADEGHGIELTWQEQNVPNVKMPTRRGFGSTVIERHLARSLDAEVKLEFPEGGARFQAIIPITQFVATL
ncbi:sensor histidine kinase [Variibacter gotjawalensis]|uniref:sensor histidine kinase n=1 Tax=Variibacter gotjawalensis TaxID=1333996 RepID=UPI001DB5A701|nr:HWE histidine kinase domain-containing protein [Variibacter gotjawalensis]NIK50146.1 PAS domain S-box-containing protein [Variibacter gotjawalensis]